MKEPGAEVLPALNTKLGGFGDRNLFLTVLEAGKLQTRDLHVGALVNSLCYCPVTSCGRERSSLCVSPRFF